MGYLRPIPGLQSSSAGRRRISRARPASKRGRDGARADCALNVPQRDEERPSIRPSANVLDRALVLRIRAPIIGPSTGEYRWIRVTEVKYDRTSCAAFASQSRAVRRAWG